MNRLKTDQRGAWDVMMARLARWWTLEDIPINARFLKKKGGERKGVFIPWKVARVIFEHPLISFVRRTWSDIVFQQRVCVCIMRVLRNELWEKRRKEQHRRMSNRSMCVNDNLKIFCMLYFCVKNIIKMYKNRRNRSLIWKRIKLYCIIYSLIIEGNDSKEKQRNLGTRSVRIRTEDALRPPIFLFFSFLTLRFVREIISHYA